jgi:hypothetical protein
MVHGKAVPDSIQRNKLRETRVRDGENGLLPLIRNPAEGSLLVKYPVVAGFFTVKEDAKVIPER